MKNSALARALVSAISLSGCVASMDATISKGNESDVPTDGKFDGASLALQGQLNWFDADPRGGMQGFDDGELTTRDRGNAWGFTLIDNATVDLSIGPVEPNGEEIDTVMYLYKEGEPDHWGRYIARNDDISDENYWSSLDSLELGVGSYRVVVKGYSRSDVGPIRAFAHCEGPGCEIGPLPDPERDATTLRIPLVLETEDHIFVRARNGLIAESGIESFPRHATVRRHDNSDLDHWFDLSDDLERVGIGPLYSPENPSALSVDALGSSKGLCYDGVARAVPDLLEMAAVRLFQDNLMVIIYTEHGHTNENEPESEQLLENDPVWQSHDPSSDDVVIAYTTNEDLNEAEAVRIPPCGQ